VTKAPSRSRLSEHAEAKRQELLELAFASGWLEDHRVVFTDLTADDVVLVIFYHNGAKRLLPWSRYGADARKLTLDLL